VIFGIFLGGKFITRVWLDEYLVNVSEFLQSFPYLNGYSVLLTFCS
jgi:hypothetical protein